MFESLAVAWFFLLCSLAKCIGTGVHQIFARKAVVSFS